MGAKDYMHVRNAVTSSITPARDSCIKSFQRLLAPLHASVSDRQAKPRPSGKLLCLFVERNCIIEASHLAIKRRQRRLAPVGKCRVKLQRSFASRGRFVVQPKVPIEL